MSERGRATRIVATIGPATSEPRPLLRLLRAGIDVVRLNAAHARPGEIARRVALVRLLEPRVGRPVGVLLDLGGPKIRVGSVAGGETRWMAGDVVELAPGRGGGGRRVAVTYGPLLDDVAPGAEVRIDDGRIRLRVERRVRGGLRARVLTGGRVKSGAGVNLPHSTLSAPALTAKDRRDLAEGLAAGVDFVGLSFVRSAAHVADLRRRLAAVPEPRRPWIVAKIERPEALADLEAIAAGSDALMVARGDLGVEIGLARVPHAQAEILAAGRAAAVPVIVATQMLESMIESAVPTRAEVSDVAGAVHGGADAVMLSGETAVGRHPVEAVRAMDEIARAAESPRDAEALPAAPARVFGTAEAIASAAARLARSCGARALVVYTESGRTARLASKERLPVPILAFTSRESVRRRLTLLRDVVSWRVPPARTVEEMIRAGDRELRRHPGLEGGLVVELSGSAKAQGATNALRVRRVAAKRPATPAAPRRPGSASGRPGRSRS